MNHYAYATLGSTCRTNANELISNYKYIPPTAADYDVIFTKAQMYPGNWQYPGGNPGNPEEKTVNYTEIGDTVKISQRCGRR